MPDPSLSQTIAEPNTILRCEVGSTVHGLGVNEQDDRDEMGVCLEPPRYAFGLNRFEQWVCRTQPEGVRSGPGDLDLTIYSARKWCSLALKGNPSAMLPLFVPESKCVILTDVGRSLRALAPAFASKKAGTAYLGYMEQQRQRIAGERGQMGVKRPELVDAYGYDTKYAGHMLRLGYQGVQYMTQGLLSLPMPDVQAQHIRDVRKGKIPLETVLEEAASLEETLKYEMDKTVLPDEPDYETVNEWLVQAYLSHWKVG